MSIPKSLGVLLVLAWVAGVLGSMWNLSLLMTAHSQTQTQTHRQIQPKSQTILTIVLRDSLGNPLEGVTTEVLSYDWGLEMGQGYSVIAKGETDKNGVVAFDSTPWPFSGYRVKFTPTSHTRPARSYFLPDSDNQYRGYPGISTGGVTETQRFVLSGSDGLIYNDLSREGQLPEYQRDPVGGLENPRVTVMPGQDFLASVAAATSTAEARGEPTPTLPPPAAPSPRPGQIQSALTFTPGPEVVSTAAAVSQAVQTTSTSTSTVSSVAGGAAVTTLPVAAASPDPGSSSSARTATAVSTVSLPGKPDPAGSTGNLVVEVLLGVVGLAALIGFWRFRFRIYSLVGIETVSKKRVKHFLAQPKQSTEARPGPDKPK